VTNKRHDQFCALARAADILGERWTLLVIRELLIGPKRFADLMAKLDGISSALLTIRLERLLAEGVIRRMTLPPPAASTVYELTDIGQDLRPAIHALIRWGGHFLFPMRRGEKFEPEWISLALEAIAKPKDAPSRDLLVVVRQDGKAARVHLGGGPGGTRLSLANDRAEATITSRFDVLLRVVARELTLEAARPHGVAVTGSLAAARNLPDYFDLRRA
jgi:DNA-binding HxlR family transcriptional regulator